MGETIRFPGTIEDHVRAGEVSFTERDVTQVCKSCGRPLGEHSLDQNRVITCAGSLGDEQIAARGIENARQEQDFKRRWAAAETYVRSEASRRQSYRDIPDPWGHRLLQAFEAGARSEARHPESCTATPSRGTTQEALANRLYELAESSHAAGLTEDAIVQAVRDGCSSIDADAENREELST